KAHKALEALWLSCLPGQAGVFFNFDCIQTFLWKWMRCDPHFCLHLHVLQAASSLYATFIHFYIKDVQTVNYQQSKQIFIEHFSRGSSLKNKSKSKSKIEQTKRELKKKLYEWEELKQKENHESTKECLASLIALAKSDKDWPWCWSIAQMQLEMNTVDEGMLLLNQFIDIMFEIVRSNHISNSNSN
ncbi:hypothetical protein RFI_35847, partial [Reticulomyxa filosa]